MVAQLSPAAAVRRHVWHPALPRITIARGGFKIAMTTSGPIKIVIAGGGTGGHILPAISVIEEVRRRELRVEFFWIGSQHGLEREAAEAAGIAFAAVATGKFRRYLDRRIAPDLIRVPAGAIQAARLLRAIRPDVIFSTGGFVSVPTVVAGARLAPILTHEQTTILGLATKINSRFATRIALSFESTSTLTGGFAQKAVVTGNPVRLSLLNGDANGAMARFGFTPELPLIYITGGARGASPLNSRIECLLPGLLETCQILHQTGPANTDQHDAERLRALQTTWPAALRARYHVTEYVREEIAGVFAAASLVVARAGAGTVAELALLGKPAILIPLPLSGGGEQMVNAKVMADAGAAILIAQSDATPERLRAEIDGLLADPVRLASLAAGAKTLGRPDAAARLTDELLALVRSRGR